MNRTEEYIKIGDTTVTSKPAMRMEIWKNVIDKAEAKSLRGSIKYLDDYVEFRYANDCANWKHMKKMILNAKGNQYSGGHFRENILFTSEIFDRIKNNQLVDADYLQGKYIIVDKLPSHSDYAGVSLNCQKIETLTPIVEDINNHHKSYLGNKVLFSYPGLVGGGSGSQADDILINGIKVKTARHKPKQTVFNSAWTADGEEWAVQEFVYAIHKKEFTKSYSPKTRTLNGKTVTIKESVYKTSFSDKSKFELLYKDFEIYEGKEVTDFYSFTGFL